MKRTAATACAASVLLAVMAVAAPPAKAQGADDRASAESLVKQLDSLDEHAAQRAVTAEALAKAKDALERGTRLRSAGDEAHAKAADGLALEWAETARDLARAANAETTGADLRKKALEQQAQLERTRTLIEEGIARVGRLKAELDEAERAARQDRTAVEVHDGSPPAHPAAAAGKGAAEPREADGAGHGRGSGKGDGSGRGKHEKQSPGGAP